MTDFNKYQWENLPDSHDREKEKKPTNIKRVARHNGLVYEIKRAIASNDYETLVKLVNVTTHSKTDKLSQIYSLSTLVAINQFCLARIKNPAYVCSKCFANSIADFRKDLKRSLARNSAILQNIIIPVEMWACKASNLARYIRRHNIQRFRFQSFGDTMNEIQAQNYCNICRAFPNVSFTIWSKNIGIWARFFSQHEKPENLIYIHSSVKINTPDSYAEKYAFVDYIFTVYEHKYAIEHNVNMNCCNGIVKRYCKECLHCYNKGNCKYINETLRDK